jgi:hypothetical protein
MHPVLWGDLAHDHQAQRLAEAARYRLVGEADTHASSEFRRAARATIAIAVALRSMIRPLRGRTSARRRAAA